MNDAGNDAAKSGEPQAATNSNSGDTGSNSGNAGSTVNTGAKLSRTALLKAAESMSAPAGFAKSNIAIPQFRPGDTVKVHAKIKEGAKERVQVFEGVVISRQGGKNGTATFTVRKISYNVGVERTFFLHSPRIEKIEMVSVGEVRRARLYYLRDLRGKSARIRSQLITGHDEPTSAQDASASEAPAAEAAAS